MCKLKKYQENIYIADIKYDYVMNVIDQAKKCNYIDKVVLFGSSLTSDCKESSDIDIAIFGQRKKASYLKSKEFKEFHRNIFIYRGDDGQDYDILYFENDSKCDDAIMHAIDCGLTIYRR